MKLTGVLGAVIAVCAIALITKFAQPLIGGIAFVCGFVPFIMSLPKDDI
jgi:hypothetical protein